MNTVRVHFYRAKGAFKAEKLPMPDLFKIFIVSK